MMPIFHEVDELCYHPEEYPYNPMTGKKNEPCKILKCKCGKNRYCPKCGYGMGCYPCDCDKREDSKDA